MHTHNNKDEIPKMSSVFIGGSRKVSRLNDLIRDRLQNIINKEFHILIGDANGSDKAIQKFFNSKNYKKVSVYCSGEDCRNNLGVWEEVHVEVQRKKKDRVFYGIKDIRMAEDCDYGLMLWDGESSGTMSNLVNVLNRRKSCLLYVSPRREFVSLKDFNSLKLILERLSPTVLNELDRKIQIKDRIDGLIEGSQTQLNIE